MIVVPGMPGIKHFFPGNPGIKSIPGKFSGNSGNWTPPYPPCEPQLKKIHIPRNINVQNPSKFEITYIRR